MVSTERCCPVVELRQYTLHPGKRDVLIELFDREFIEAQEALGMKIIGQFRDLDRSNRFAWLRGFSDMGSRARALADFYGGPVWKAHRERANATMVDSDNVLLLRPASASTGFSFADKSRPPAEVSELPKRSILATIYYFELSVADDFIEFFEKAIKPAAIADGATPLAYFVSEHSKNTFPALPVRENENVFVWFAGFNDLAACGAYLSKIAQSEAWRRGINEELARQLKGEPEIIRMSPTARSLL
jgi:hypothetical protein